MSHHRSAFTLLEIMIAMLILAITIAAAGTAIDQGQRFSERISLENELTDKVNRVLNDLALELRTADAKPQDLHIGGTAAALIAPPTSGFTGAAYNTYDLIYQYQISNGIVDIPATAGPPATVESFGGQFESTYHRLVYDPGQPDASGNFNGYGTLTKELWDSTGTTRLWSVMLCDQLAPKSSLPNGAFFIQQIGNTLAMQLAVQTSYRAGYQGESIIKVANSQVLFLRSTLDTNLGSAAYNKSDAVFTGDSTTSQTPTLLFGHLITYASVANTGEISIFVQPPIGQTLNGTNTITAGSTNARGVTVTVNTYDALGNANPSVTMVEGSSVAVSPYSSGLTRTTLPDKNGNVTVTLYGNVTGSLTVTATATTTAGLSTTATKTF